MKISTLLDHIDNGHMALPEFQRGYVWNRDQVRGLFDSLYRRHPVGGLLVWATESQTAQHRGGAQLAPGIVKLLLDGQQRMTSLYGVVRGRAPKFFDGNAQTFTGLHFHLQQELFEFYQPVKMRDDPLWIDVTELLRDGQAGQLALGRRLMEHPQVGMENFMLYQPRILQLLGIITIDLHVEEVTGPDKTLDVVVDIFNRVNSGGTKLSKGDLALAKICADWPEGRGVLKAKLAEWTAHGYDFTLDWLLRSVNTVLTGEARFQYLHERNAEELQDAVERATRQVDTSLNLIAGRLGLDHDRVLFGRFGIPVMARYLDQRQQQKLGAMSAQERDKLLFWFAQSGMWGRYSGSTESALDRDLGMLAGESGGLDQLLDELRQWHGGLRAEPEHFGGWSLGARFYPVLYLLTRMGEARDWGSGLPLKASLHGKLSRLEVHHIFPKSQLYKKGYKRRDVNALANFCFLTKDTNLDISDKLPQRYFPQVEKLHPGALASQWIPEDERLWKADHYLDFLEARKELLAKELNKRMQELLHGDKRWLKERAPLEEVTLESRPSDDEVEAAELQALGEWMASLGLPKGQRDYECFDEATGERIGMFDLAWPNGVQEGLSTPVVVLLHEEDALAAKANEAGYKVFRTVGRFRRYVEREVAGV